MENITRPSGKSSLRRKNVFTSKNTEEISSSDNPPASLQLTRTVKIQSTSKPFIAAWRSDARTVPLANKSVDLILTSPAYWQKRDYGFKKQIGRESSPKKYAKSIVRIMEGWKPILKKTGSVFLNVGDSYQNGCLLEIPSLITLLAKESGWKLRHRIIWEKPNSTPHAAPRRLASREEYILHFTLSNKYYSDLEGYKEKFGSVSNVWKICPAQHQGEHLAPFPEELVERILTLACPKIVCVKCSLPFVRQIEKTAELDETRPQARRAMEIANVAFANGSLNKNHIAAIQAVGISDAGKAIKFQTGAGKNVESVKALAKEAKKILGGYSREFTFAKKKTVDWKGCNCNNAIKPGLVYDPFVGTGTTLRVAGRLGLSAIGSDLRLYDDLKETLEKLVVKPQADKLISLL